MPNSTDPGVLLGDGCRIASIREASLNSHLFINRDLHEGEILSVGPGIAAVYSARSPDRDRDKNEDTAAVIQVDPVAGVLAVADGAGGLRGGEHASEIAVKQLSASITGALEDDRELRYGILNGFERANHSIIEMAIGAATTLSAVEIQGNRIRPYHVGDSAIIVVGQRGKIKKQTVAHSPVGYGVESGLLDENTAMFHEDRHLISNMLGSPEMHIEVGPPLELSAHDTVILATDGLPDNLHTHEIVELIRKGPIDRLPTALADLARHRMQNPGNEHPSKPDDLTFIVFRLSA